MTLLDNLLFVFSILSKKPCLSEFPHCSLFPNFEVVWMSALVIQFITNMSIILMDVYFFSLVKKGLFCFLNGS